MKIKLKDLLQDEMNWIDLLKRDLLQGLVFIYPDNEDYIKVYDKLMSVVEKRRGFLSITQFIEHRNTTFADILLCVTEADV